ncbi:GCLC [Mytilus edulis]|uniref:Glutamate--cysteine ligase n=1 Tax=Mytilus edulis TaxID=6550 RepID=A0A8S3SX94_MYTED|nr:GCLC [Mytilus edulis]
MDKKDQLFVVNEICEMKNCNKCIFFEAKKRKDLYMWIANAPRGPSVKFLVENVHTMLELKMTGNCLKGSRPLLSFDKTFDSEPHWTLMKELFTQIEYMIVKIDDEEKTTKLCLKAKDVLETLNKRNIGNRTPIWTPEFGAYMVESIPERPYSDLLYSISEVELSMKERRKELTSVLEEDEIPFTLPAYPRLGVGYFAVPSTELNPNNVTSACGIFPDDVMGNTKNNEVAIYQDIKTKSAFPAVIKTKCKMEQSYDNSIYMEGLVFGAGCCGLQTTFQMDNLDEARFLYDQLVNICPIMLALSAASPVHRGYLSDIDTRWPVLSQSFDDRTDEEKGQKPLKNDRFRIQKSRWSSVETYICPEHSQYNNTDIVYDKDSYEELKNEGLDEALSKHIAYLFIRDPLFLCSETLDQDEILDIQHLEVSLNT